METVQQLSKVRSRDRKAERRQRNSEAKKPQCAAGNAAHAFLTQEVLPICLRKDVIPDSDIKEACFFQSLENLRSYYGLQMPELPDLPFPQNISYAFAQVKDALARIDKSIIPMIIEDDTQPACLATAKVYNTGWHLYYLPLEPVWRKMQKARNKKNTQLLLSVLAYVKQVLQVPSYDEDCYSYMSGTIGCIYEMTKEDKEAFSTVKEYREAVADVRQVNTKGKKMIQVISDGSHRAAFEKRLKYFTPTNEDEQQLFSVAEKAFNLWHEYPQAYDTNIFYNLISPEEEERAPSEQYVSFVWYAEGWVSDTVEQMVNEDGGNQGILEEPVSVILHDQPRQTTTQEFDFEKKMFSLLDDLATYLYNMP